MFHPKETGKKTFTQNMVQRLGRRTGRRGAAGHRGPLMPLRALSLGLLASGLAQKATLES